MEKKEKILTIIFFSAIVLSILTSFLKFFVFKNYLIKFETGCDPAIESCFVSECDPEEDEECVPGEEKSYYKLVEKKAFAVPKCNLENGNCPAIGCQPREKNCVETLCSEDVLGEGQSCSDPETYLREQEELKAAEEAAALEEGDEEGGADQNLEAGEELESEDEVGSDSLEAPGDSKESPGEADQNVEL
mgnify:CR=1 FL=1